MSDYRLSRTRSAAIVRSSSIDSRPTVLLTRTYSVPDVSSYLRTDRYRPTYSYRSSWVWPYRYYKDYSLGDDYWYDRYYNFSLFPRRYYYSDYVSNPYYWSYPYSYWTRYKGYMYDYSTPYYSRSYTSPYWNSHYGYGGYLSTYYSPYRSYLIDCMTKNLTGGLEMYRKGVINFSVLNRNWLKSDWDSTLREWTLLYNRKYASSRVPSTFSANPPQYATKWIE